MTAGPYNTVATAPQRQAERAAAGSLLAGSVLACAAAVVLAVVYTASAATVLGAVLVGSVPGVLAAVAVLRRRPLSVTAADRVTLARAALAGGCTAVTAMALVGAVPARTWWLLALAAPMLALDAVDGLVARRTGSVTQAGARLDYQVDSGVLVVLSLVVVPVLGAWVLLVGAMRYVFVAASWVRPALRSRLAYSEFRRWVAGLQGAVLAVAIAPVVPLPVAWAAVLLGLGLLVVSFGRDVRTLEGAARVSARARALAS
jgi:phosphatidylglycerophosphate synthase